MANKGGRKTLKRIASSKARNVSRKELAWTIRSAPGPHNKENSVPLGFVIRDLIQLTENAKETKILLNSGKVKVNGKDRKDEKLPVGLFDILQIEETKKAFRLVFEKHGRLEAKEVKFAAKQHLVCKITGKKMLSKNSIQLVTNNGMNFTVAEKDSIAKAKPGDSLLVDFSGKIEKVLELKKGNLVYIVAGKHVSDTAKVVSVAESTMQRPKLIALEAEEETYSTVAENVFVIGEEKSSIEF